MWTAGVIYRVCHLGLLLSNVIFFYNLVASLDDNFLIMDISYFLKIIRMQEKLLNQISQIIIPFCNRSVRVICNHLT